MLKLYLFKDDTASLFNEEHLVLMIFMRLHAMWFLLHLSVFAHSAFFLACCSHSDSAVCPLCFMGSVCSVLLASHLMCQTEARVYSLLNFNTSHRFHTGTFTLTAHCTLSELYLLGFSFVFWLQGRPPVSFTVGIVDATNYLLLNHRVLRKPLRGM